MQGSRSGVAFLWRRNTVLLLFAAGGADRDRVGTDNRRGASVFLLQVRYI